MVRYLGGRMRQLVRRLRSCETGSALTEYGLLIAVVALGLIALLAGFRNAVGDLTNRTSVTITKQSSRGFRYHGGGVRPIGGKPAPDAPAEPEPEPDSGDSTGVAIGSERAASSGQ
jgi:Flp pilus assembly pilin Flp